MESDRQCLEKQLQIYCKKKFIQNNLVKICEAKPYQPKSAKKKYHFTNQRPPADLVPASSSELPRTLSFTCGR